MPNTLKSMICSGVRRLSGAAFVFAILTTYAAQPAFADPLSGDTLNTTLDNAANDENPLGFGQGSFVVAPVPFKNVLIGGGLVLGGGYLFNIDEGSDTSVIGIGGLRSENGTNAFGLGGKLVFDQNRWQLSASLGQAEGFYDLYVGGIPVPVRQTGDVFNLSVLRGVTSELLFGAGVRYLDTTLGYGGSGGGLPPLPESQLRVALFNLLAKWDTRDDSFSARSGNLLEGTLSYGEVLDSSTRTYQRAIVTYNHYLPVGAQNAVALRLAACTNSTSTPFFDKCSLGGTDAFRGFSPTEFLNDALLSAQLEYRQQIGSRFGAVLFAGAGNTAANFADLGDTDFRYAGGLGLRFQLSKKFKATLSLDASINDRDEDLLYIYVGQRF
ncbi:BamA/TamA family outer membrane protein [Shimia sp.]|uniref:BamA/TamA family outer membrane protein n=1 Tax=Shimia sp. TaxID=1954381 RepID=UPI003B8D6DA7